MLKCVILEILLINRYFTSWYDMPRLALLYYIEYLCCAVLCYDYIVVLDV